MRRFISGLALLGLGLGLVLQAVQYSDAFTRPKEVVLLSKKAFAPANFSLVLASASSQYLSITGKTGINQQKFAFAFAFKTSTSGIQELFYFGDGTSSNQVSALLNSGALTLTGVTAGSTVFSLSTSASSFADGNWHSFFFGMDTTQATANNRAILDIDGTAPALGGNTQPAQNTNLSNNFAATYRIGSFFSGTRFFNGKLAQFRYIDGQQRSYSDFYNVSNVPITYTGGFTGTFDFVLPFSNAASLGADSSGESNNWTPQNSPTQSTDYP